MTGKHLDTDMGTHLLKWLLGIALSFVGLVYLRCSTELTECAGPMLDVPTLRSMRQNFFALGGSQKASLVYPNPILATGNIAIEATSSELTRAVRLFSIGNLIASDRLESDFVKIRATAIDSPPSAKPDPQGIYQYSITDPRYSEVLQYYSVAGLLNYVERLGFKINKSKPLYVLVSVAETGGSPNAFYEHNSFTGKAYREIRFVGTGSYRPSVDATIGLHEVTHNIIENASYERGIDSDGERLAMATHGSFIHEGVADVLADSIIDQPAVGSWLARNFNDIALGDPLRSAVDRPGKTLDYQTVMENDGSGKRPERYEVAEWLSRVLWDIRQAFLGEDSESGAIFFERLMLTGLGHLYENTSLREFRDALIKTDEQMHCGLHRRSISRAFSGRGFQPNPPDLKEPLALQARPVGLTNQNGQFQIVNLAPGIEGSFEITLTNPNSVVADDVRIRLESSGPFLHIQTPGQGLGNLAAGKTITIGSRGLSFLYSVGFLVDSGAPRGSVIPYTLRVSTGNGDPTILSGEIRL